MTSRRDFLALALWTPLASCAAAVPKFAAYPFSLGVASGYPHSDSVLIWTRLAPSLAGGGMEPEPAPVRWELAEDEGFKRIVRKGSALALPENAHALRVEVDGLAPARVYHYRFHCADATSATGRTRTAPGAGQADTRLRLAVASCQQYEQGYYVAHRHLAAEDCDLVAFVGDYIYESSWGRDHVRKHGTPEPVTLADYRDRYALYKSDADLQAAHAAAPWVTIWDDHEVDNDYAADRSEELDPAFAKRRVAAYKAFFEHMPLRPSVLLADGGVRIIDRLDWGGLAQLHLLDGRQYRSPQACPKPNRGGSTMVGAECTDRLDPALSLLGAEQERWLDQGLGSSRAAWNLIVQTTLFVPAPAPSRNGAPVWWTDGWDGYPAARERLVKSIVERRPANPVILGGDVHCAVHANVHARPESPDSPVVAAEFVCTSITSQGFSSAKASAAMRALNPHIRHHDGMTRGYHLIEIGRDGLQASVRGVETVKRGDSRIATVASARVASGRAGLAD
jgi:alkaline phosphatase D